MSRDASMTIGWRYRLLIDAMIGSIGLVAVIAIIGLVIDLGIDLYFRILSCAALVALCLVLLVAAGAVLRRGRYRIQMRLGIAVVIIGTAVAMVAVWWEPEFPYRQTLLLRNIAFTLLALSAAIAHSGVLGMLPVKTRLLRLARSLTIWSVTLSLLLIGAVFWTQSADWAWWHPIIETLAAFLFVLLPGGIIGTIIVPITVLSRANRRELPAESMDSRITLQLECPLCAYPQRVRMGNVRCVDCGGGLFVQVEEPRCECGYLLYRLESPTCPECGRMVDPAMCWSGQDETGATGESASDCTCAGARGSAEDGSTTAPEQE